MYFQDKVLILHPNNKVSNNQPKNERYRKSIFGSWLSIPVMLSACENSNLTQSGLNPADFDSTVLGKKTELVTLKNNQGMEVCLTNYGGRVVSISVPNKDGKPTDVVLGYDNIHQYADTLNSPSDYRSLCRSLCQPHQGLQITVEWSDYQLKANDNGNCLAWWRCYWLVEPGLRRNSQKQIHPLHSLSMLRMARMASLVMLQEQLPIPSRATTL